MPEKKLQKFRMQFGMKEHPDTGVLLFPGDVFTCDPADILKPPEFGGWLQREKDPAVQKPEEPVRWHLICAVPVPDSVEEGLIMRDEPSQIIGVNISEHEYLTMERAREQREGATFPPVGKSSPASGRARG